MKNDRQRPKASLGDRLLLYVCKNRSVDGLWIGAEGEPGLRRVEEALGVIKLYDPVQYAHIVRYLERIWVSLLPIGRACFRSSLKACILDERYVLAPTTTPEMIATTIVHEATHARVDHCGIMYREKERVRIEEVCMRRELAFASRLPQGKSLQEGVEHRIEWYANKPEYFSNANFRQRDIEGRIEALRHLGMPNWLVRAVIKIAMGISVSRRFVRRIARPTAF